MFFVTSYSQVLCKMKNSGIMEETMRVGKLQNGGQFEQTEKVLHNLASSKAFEFELLTKRRKKLAFEKCVTLS